MNGEMYGKMKGALKRAGEFVIRKMIKFLERNSFQFHHKLIKQIYLFNYLTG